jgi:hypothetical protein
VAAEEESSQANAADHGHPEKRPHSLGSGEHVYSEGAKEIGHHDDGQGADDAGDEAIPLGLKRRKIEEAGAGRVLGNDEDVVFARREAMAASGCPGVLAMGRRRRRCLAHVVRGACRPRGRTAWLCVGVVAMNEDLDGQDDRRGCGLSQGRIIKSWQLRNKGVACQFQVADDGVRVARGKAPSRHCATETYSLPMEKEEKGNEKPRS